MATSSGVAETVQDVEMPAANGASSLTQNDTQNDTQKSTRHRLRSKAAPSQEYISQMHWTDEEGKERAKLLSKLSRSLPDAPSPALSAWLIFCNEYSAKKGVAGGAIFAEAGKHWKALSAEEKTPYEEKSKELKESSKVELEKLKDSPAYKDLCSEVDKLLLVNRARTTLHKKELSWKQWKATLCVKAPGATIKIWVDEGYSLP